MFSKFALIVLLLAAAVSGVSAQGRSRARTAVDDDAFLDDLSRRAFNYFWEQSDPSTGLTRDRANKNGASVPTSDGSFNIASTAATGFALSSYCVGAERGWVTPAEARARTRATLDFFANRAVHKNGWFYHWMDAPTGERRWNSEFSSIDTGLLLAGVLTVRQCFADDAQVVALATTIYERVDFQWMLNGHPYLLSHGWVPETGWIPFRWDTYSEHLVLTLLAIASRTHPIPPRSWYEWRRSWTSYGGYRYLAGTSPLFIHQFSHAWIDFRHRRERRPPFTNYFANSIAATYAQRQYFIDVLSASFPLYSGTIWGLTSSDSANGYVGWGAPPRHPATDGTVVPCAVAGSLMFAPEITVPALRDMQARYGAAYDYYGFADAFNPHNGWVNRDVIGIDVGITLLSAENLRSGRVWSWFMQNPEVRQTLRRLSVI